MTGSLQRAAVGGGTSGPIGRADVTAIMGPLGSSCKTDPLPTGATVDAPLATPLGLSVVTVTGKAEPSDRNAAIATTQSTFIALGVTGAAAGTGVGVMGEGRSSSESGRRST